MIRRADEFFLEGSRRLVEAAEAALEMLARRNQLAACEEKDVSTEGIPVDVDEQ